MPEGAIRRVLMTCDAIGGVWTFALELAEGLGAHGVEVVLVALGGFPSQAQKDAAARIPNVFLLSSDLKLEWMSNPWADVEASRRLIVGLAEEYSPDLIHLNTCGHGGLRFPCPVVLTAHSCVLSWWDAVKREPAPAEWNRYRSAVTSALNSADTITAPTAAMARSLRENYRFDNSVLSVIHNGRDGKKFRTLTKEPFIFTAGRLQDSGKNASALAAIASRLSWPVFTAGEEQTCLPSLGVLSSDQIAAVYSRAGIYALPARYEPFGLSALEAALSGCPLVLGEIPSLREVWEDSALFVEPDDTETLLNVLEELIADVNLRKEMAFRAHQRARFFSADRMTSRDLDVYRAAICRGSQCAS